MNKELLEYFNPAINSLPYMYDSFTEWGLCTDWDPCPTCDEDEMVEGVELIAPVQLNARQRTGTRRLGSIQ